MNTNFVLASLVVLALVVLGAWMYSSGNIPALVINSAEQNVPLAGEEEADETTEDEGPIGDPEFHALISYTDEGFVPESVNIERGQTVRFVNNASAETGTWPASAVHPTHTIYPGSGISKCDTSEQSSIFDACRELQPGEFWEFTFTEAGEWRYHDHTHAYHTGAVIVAE